jgi:pilus assembly protein HofM
VLVALRYARSRWALRRWWDIELAPGIVRQGMVVDVARWPNGCSLAAGAALQHQVSIAFPASRTLQKQLPRPQLSLSDREQATWIASAMAQQLEMPAASLCVDYCAAPAKNEWRVTAAQRLDIDVLRQLAARLKLRIAELYRMPARWRHFSLATLRFARPGVAPRSSLAVGNGRAGAVCRALKPLLFHNSPC